MQKISLAALTMAAAMTVGVGSFNRASWAGPVAGDNEVEISGGAFHRQGSSSGAFSADIKYGYFLTQGWEVGLRQGVNYSFIDNGQDFWTATTTPFVHYNFNFGKFVPYLGGSIGAVYNDRDASGVAGPNAGLKLFFDDQTFLNIGYRYEFFFSRFRDIDNRTNRGNHVTNIGIGFAWGGNRSTAGGRKP